MLSLSSSERTIITLDLSAELIFALGELLPYLFNDNEDFDDHSGSLSQCSIPKTNSFLKSTNSSASDMEDSEIKKPHQVISGAHTIGNNAKDGDKNDVTLFQEVPRFL